MPTVVIGSNFVPAVNSAKGITVTIPDKINKISVHRVGDVFFKVKDGMFLKWSSDFNEGIIDLFSGKAG